MTKNQIENFSFFGILAVVSFALFFVFQPVLKVLLIAVVLAILLNRPYEKLVKFFGGYRTLTSFVFVCIVLLFCIVPVFYFGSQVFGETQSVYIKVTGNEAHYIHLLQSSVEKPLKHIFPAFSFNINSFIANTLGFVSNNLAGLVSQTIVVFFDIFLVLLALFFFLQDGKVMLGEITAVSPFKRESTDEILKTMYATINAVMRGTIFVALVRWVIVSTCFFIFGIPNALLWGSLGGLVGAIPGLGTFFAFAPAIVFLYLQGSAIGALGTGLFAIVTVVLVDNLLTAFYLRKGLKTSPIFTLFSIFGGIALFGPIGFIFGPLILSVFLSLINVYADFLHNKSNS